MIKDNASGDSTSTPARIVVVLNWVEELKARVTKSAVRQRRHERPAG